MTASAPQLRLLQILTQHRVEFVLVGGHAVAAHGHERATRDVDIVFATSAENGQRFAAALAEAGALVSLADVPEPRGGITGEWLAAGGHFRFTTELGPLDALSEMSGRAYADLAPGAVAADLGDGTIVRVCSYEDLVALKQQAARPQDLLDLERLEEVRGDR